MATTPAIAAGTPRGITNTLAGYVEISYDTRTDLRLTVRSATTGATAPATAGATNFQYAGSKWKVDSCEEAGSYNGLRRWNINAHKYENWPPQT